MDARQPNSFQILLEYLDADELNASEKYLTLHLKLTKTLIWKGCPEFEADNLADTTLDRVARKINEIERKLAEGIKEENGKAIKKIENINAYALEVNRLVWLEHWRKHIKPRIDDDGELPETPVQPADLPDEPDVRLRCLRKCLAEKIPDDADKQLILGYYDNEFEEKNKEIRKALADKLGITTVNLKVKACRLRERLEKCINECAARLAVTDSPVYDTDKRGDSAR